MSADNWTSCPKCNKEFNDELKSLKDRLATDYGKISRDDYRELESIVDRKSKAIKDMNLAEYYEIWIDNDGKFFCRYNCVCSDCGFSYQFNHTEFVDLGDKE